MTYIFKIPKDRSYYCNDFKKLHFFTLISYYLVYLCSVDWFMLYIWLRKTFLWISSCIFSNLMTFVCLPANKMKSKKVSDSLWIGTTKNASALSVSKVSPPQYASLRVSTSVSGLTSVSFIAHVCLTYLHKCKKRCTHLHNCVSACSALSTFPFRI